MAGAAGVVKPAWRTGPRRRLAAARGVRRAGRRRGVRSRGVWRGGGVRRSRRIGRLRAAAELVGPAARLGDDLLGALVGLTDDACGRVVALLAEPVGGEPRGGAGGRTVGARDERVRALVGLGPGAVGEALRLGADGGGALLGLAHELVRLRGEACTCGVDALLRALLHVLEPGLDLLAHRALHGLPRRGHRSPRVHADRGIHHAAGEPDTELDDVAGLVVEADPLPTPEARRARLVRLGAEQLALDVDAERVVERAVGAVGAGVAHRDVAQTDVEGLEVQPP